MSDKIIVKHSSIVINNYTIGENRSLESNFTLYDRNTYNYYYMGMDYNKVTKTLIIPRGLDIPYLENTFNCRAKVDKNHDPLELVEPIQLKYLPRDEVQKEALQFMTGNSVQYKKNQAKSQLSVNLNTGKGKTYCSIATAAVYGLRSAIITSSIDWLRQWKEFILEYTDTKPMEIYLLSGAPSIQRLLSKGVSKYKFILISHSTIKSYGDTYGWDKVSELFKFMKIGLKFYDECHLNFTNMCKIDFYTNTYKTYYVTATPARSDSAENRIFQLYFKNIPSIVLFDEEEDPHTRYVAIRYNSKPSPLDLSKCSNPKYGLDRNKYMSSYIIKNQNFYKMLRIVLDIVLPKGKTLMYIGNNYAISVIHEWICENYPELENEVGIYTSVIPERDKQSQKQKRLILSTTKSMGAAEDIKGLKCTVVLAEPFKSEVLAKQTLGRTRDKDTMYIEVVDTGFRQIQKYYYYKKPVFEKYATDCMEINLTQSELDTRSSRIEKKRDKFLEEYYAPKIEYISPFKEYNKDVLISPFKSI